MTPLEILRGARELLAKPERWTKGTWARANTVPVLAENSEADCFCLVAAILRAAGSWAAAREALPVLADMVRTAPAHAGMLMAPIVCFSDDPNATHADILALLDRGIAELEKSQ